MCRNSQEVEALRITKIKFSGVNEQGWKFLGSRGWTEIGDGAGRWHKNYGEIGQVNYMTFYEALDYEIEAALNG